MKAILFDLGDTLESGGSPVPDALATLKGIQAMRDQEGHAPLLGLVSDFNLASSPEEVAAVRLEYMGIITTLGIREFFEPVATHVTLSTEVGLNKPNAKIFRTALNRLHAHLSFRAAAFVTENAAHMAAVRALGMKGICIRENAEAHPDDVETLGDTLPRLAAWIAT